MQLQSLGRYLKMVTIILTTAWLGPDGPTFVFTTRFPARAPQSGAEGLSPSKVLSEHRQSHA